MAMYLAEISFLLSVALLAAGLVLWHRGREASAGLVRAAAAILIVGAALTMLCNGYFSVRYHVQGEFDHAYAHPAAMGGRGAPGPACPHLRQRPMGEATMGSGMMGPGMMHGAGQTPMGPGGAPGPGSSDTLPGHDEHHPGDDS